MGKVEAEKRSHAIFWGNMQWPYPRSHAASGLPAHGKENGENGTPLMMSHRNASVEAILRMVQERMSSGPVLSRTSSSSSGMGGMASSSSMQLQLVDDPIPGGFDAAAQQPLKRLDFVRTQGGFWLTWMTSAYSTGRAFMPLPGSLIDVLEYKVSPLVAAVSHTSEKALQVLDAKVDTVMSGLANLGLAAMPPVDAVVRTAAPTAEAIVERYQQAHDALVAAPIYLRVSESAAGAIQHVHESRWYKILLPLVAPLADPAVKRIMNSPAFQAVKEHLMPITGPETAAQQPCLLRENTA